MDAVCDYVTEKFVLRNQSKLNCAGSNVQRPFSIVFLGLAAIVSGNIAISSDKYES